MEDLRIPKVVAEAVQMDWRVQMLKNCTLKAGSCKMFNFLDMEVNMEVCVLRHFEKRGSSSGFGWIKL